MTFEEAAKVGKVVIDAGAGISKDSPANLPSWWDYNILLGASEKWVQKH